MAAIAWLLALTSASVAEAQSQPSPADMFEARQKCQAIADGFERRDYLMSGRGWTSNFNLKGYHCYLKMVDLPRNDSRTIDLYDGNTKEMLVHIEQKNVAEKWVTTQRYLRSSI